MVSTGTNLVRTASDPEWMRVHRQVWNAKAGLRAHYKSEIFDRLLESADVGPMLEIGAGPGFFKAYHPEHVAIDVCFTQSLDACADVHSLPFAMNSFQSIVGVDVIHHLARPEDALNEMTRVLMPGGTINLVEPWTGGLAQFIYRWAHHEDSHVLIDPWQDAFAGEKSPMDGNTMIPKQLFVDDAKTFAHRLPALQQISFQAFGSLSYLLTGGFQPPGTPQWLTDGLAALERCLPQCVMRLVGTRAHYTILKRAT